MGVTAWTAVASKNEQEESDLERGRDLVVKMPRMICLMMPSVELMRALLRKIMRKMKKKSKNKKMMKKSTDKMRKKKKKKKKKVKKKKYKNKKNLTLRQSEILVVMTPQMIRLLTTSAEMMRTLMRKKMKQ